MTTRNSLLTDKSALNHTRISTTALAPLKSGEVLMKIGRVAVTTNNIT